MLPWMFWAWLARRHRIVGRGRAGVENNCFTVNVAVTCRVGKVTALNVVVLVNKSPRDWPPSISGTPKRNAARIKSPPQLKCIC